MSNQIKSKQKNSHIIAYIPGLTNLVCGAHELPPDHEICLTEYFFTINVLMHFNTYPNLDPNIEEFPLGQPVSHKSEW